MYEVKEDKEKVPDEKIKEEKKKEKEEKHVPGTVVIAGFWV